MTSTKVREWNTEHKVYVGNLGENISREELKEVFSQYGTVKSVYIGTAAPGFAFIEYENPKTAEEVAKYLDSTRSVGAPLEKVQKSWGRGSTSSSFSGQGYRGGDRHSPVLRPSSKSEYRPYPKSRR